MVDVIGVDTVIGIVGSGLAFVSIYGSIVYYVAGGGVSFISFTIGEGVVVVRYNFGGVVGGSDSRVSTVRYRSGLVCRMFFKSFVSCFRILFIVFCCLFFTS